MQNKQILCLSQSYPILSSVSCAPAGLSLCFLNFPLHIGCIVISALGRLLTAQRPLKPGDRPCPILLGGKSLPGPLLGRLC